MHTAVPAPPQRPEAAEPKDKRGADKRGADKRGADKRSRQDEARREEEACRKASETLRSEREKAIAEAIVKVNATLPSRKTKYPAVVGRIDKDLLRRAMAGPDTDVQKKFTEEADYYEAVCCKNAMSLWLLLLRPICEQFRSSRLPGSEFPSAKKVALYKHARQYLVRHMRPTRSETHLNLAMLHKILTHTDEFEGLPMGILAAAVWRLGYCDRAEWEVKVRPEDMKISAYFIAQGTDFECVPKHYLQTTAPLGFRNRLYGIGAVISRGDLDLGRDPELTAGGSVSEGEAGGGGSGGGAWAAKPGFSLCTEGWDTLLDAAHKYYEACRRWHGLPDATRSPQVPAKDLVRDILGTRVQSGEDGSLGDLAQTGINLLQTFVSSPPSALAWEARSGDRNTRLVWMFVAAALMARLDSDPGLDSGAISKKEVEKIRKGSWWGVAQVPGVEVEVAGVGVDGGAGAGAGLPRLTWGAGALHAARGGGAA